MSKPTHVDKAWRAEVRFVTALHDTVLREQEGADFLKLTTEVRDLTHRLRTQYTTRDEARLHRILHGLGVEEIVTLSRSFTLFFWLLNLCEERGAPRTTSVDQAGSLADLFRRLDRQGVPGALVAEVIATLRARIVLTAHPTETMRWSVRQSLDRMAILLDHRAETLSYGRRRVEREVAQSWIEETEAELAAEVTGLWQTTTLRHRAPTPLDEVRYAIHVLDTSLVDAVPQVTDRLAEEFAAVYGEYPPNAAETLSVGSWVGGDRDGNPFVTAEVTTKALRMYRRAIIEHYREQIGPLLRRLTQSTNRIAVSKELETSVERDLKALPALRKLVEGRNPSEIYRKKLNAIALRLDASLEETQADEAPGSRGGYERAADLRADIQLIRESLKAHRGERLAQGRLRHFSEKAGVFGFHFVTLDVRQNQARHTEARSELICPVQGPLHELSLDDQRKFLEELVFADVLPTTDAVTMSPETTEVLDTLRGVRSAIDEYGPGALRDLVISDTENAAPVLELLVLARYADLVTPVGKAKLESRVNIVPLFESIESLRGAVRAMDRLYRSPAYLAQLEARGMRQQIMLGYSDSVKDGGYLAACDALERAQRELAEHARGFGVKLTFFHGRGGTIARGGGPTHAAILAQPPGTVGGTLKLTEQGEIVSAKYATVESAVHHLERVISATLEASLPIGLLSKERKIAPGWRDAMEVLAVRSREVFRELVYERDDFVDVFYALTPIEEIADMQIGSRPAKRTTTRSIRSLRAIPWTFAWNQSRVLLPSWYGAGSGIEHFTATHPGGREKALARLRTMYRRWPFFRAVIDNLTQVLAKTDLHVAANYLEIARESVPGASDVFHAIEQEYQRTRRAVRDVSGERKLLANAPVLRETLDLRAPYLDPLSYLQVELLDRKRTGRGLEGEMGKVESQRINRAIQLTINGIAAGLRNTG